MCRKALPDGRRTAVASHCGAPSCFRRRSLLLQNKGRPWRRGRTQQVPPRIERSGPEDKHPHVIKISLEAVETARLTAEAQHTVIGRRYSLCFDFIRIHIETRASSGANGSRRRASRTGRSTRHRQGRKRRVTTLSCDDGPSDLELDTGPTGAKETLAFGLPRAEAGSRLTVGSR